MKTCKRLCDREMRDGVLQNIALHGNRHAYSPGKSTESTLHAIFSKNKEVINP